PPGGEHADAHPWIEAIGRVLERIGVDRNAHRTKMSGTDRDPDVIDLARINVRLDLEADRPARADDKFIRPEGRIGEVNPRGCRVPYQTAAAWRGGNGLARRLLGGRP